MWEKKRAFSNKFSDVDEPSDCKRFVRLYMQSMVCAVEGKGGLGPQS